MDVIFTWPVDVRAIDSAGASLVKKARDWLGHAKALGQSTLGLLRGGNGVGSDVSAIAY